MSAIDASWSWNIFADIRDMWSYPFMLNAFRAGSIAAVVAGAVGWFVVLRKQSFVGHTLAISAFPGAAGATLLGISATVGYFAFAIVGALAIAVGVGPHRRLSDESAAVGTLQAFMLGCGFLFVYLYNGFLGSVTAPLFGSSFAITTGQVLSFGVIGVLVLGVLAAVGRPLFFASVDADVAAARGVRLRLQGTLFLMILGFAAAQASQLAGALLVFSLLVMPAATAQRLSANPTASLALTVILALFATWAGLTLAFYSLYPLGFCITSFAFIGYLASRIVGRRRWRTS